jgi:2-oxo-4-hydroxy-4-carboxy-5-ureidoimidazoline decarboxylase
VTLAQINSLDREQFVQKLGGIYEHSQWVAESVMQQRPFHSRDALRDLMRAAVENAGRERQLALLIAHPDLGTRARIGEVSAREQKGAGINHLSEHEYETLLMLNRQYRDKFGFPFIYAVRGSDKNDILEALNVRLTSDVEDQLGQALREVHRIAAFRLEDLVEEQ